MQQSFGLIALALPAVFGGISSTFSSSDLIQNPSFGNLKATIDTNLELAGNKAKLFLNYDLEKNKDFINDVKLEGALADVKYTLTHAFGKRATGMKLSSKQAGHTLKVVGDSTDMLTSLSAQGTTSVRGIDIDYEPTYLLKSKIAKLKLGAKFDGGLSATGFITATRDGTVASDYELGYTTQLGEGRSMTATVSLKEKTGEVSVVDKTLESGATWVASMDMAIDTKPALTLRRSMSF